MYESFSEHGKDLSLEAWSAASQQAWNRWHFFCGLFSSPPQLGSVSTVFEVSLLDKEAEER